MCTVCYKWIIILLSVLKPLKKLVKLYLVFCPVVPVALLTSAHNFLKGGHTFTEKGRNARGMLVQLSCLMSHCVICKVTCSCKHRQPSVVPGPAGSQVRLNTWETRRAAAL